MPIIGINFDKLYVEKKGEIKPPLSINTNVNVTEMKKEDLSFSSKDSQVLRLDFEFKLEYKPDVAAMSIGGHIHFLENNKDIDSMLKEWKKEKKLKKEFAREILNSVLIKSNIKALLLSQEVNLPPHIRLPVLQEASKK
ncbi:MAG: hypothetical protein ABIB71_04795 [Candidatus Woesearchaeota archaeon]